MLAWLLLAPLVAAAGTWLARAYALRRRLLDEPGERRSHATATPRGGGIGPVLGCTAVIAWEGTQRGLPTADWRWVLAALLAVTFVGAWDDHRPLDARIRLSVHLAAGVGLALAFGSGADVLAVASFALATAVLVNVWNFMDGINGLATTQAVLTLLTAAALVDSGWGPLLLAMGAAVSAFLPFNFPRARIFLGDAGSGALGALIVISMAAVAAQSPSGIASTALLLFPCAAFMVDASLTLLRRMAAGERWWMPHTQHLYQALARRHGHTRVTLGYAAWTATGAISAVAIEGRSLALIISGLTLWYALSASCWIGLQRRSTHGAAK